MEVSEYVFFALELLGTVAFALSGAMVAVARGTDLFGVLVLGVLTATGGGMLRDILLGSLPPRIFFRQGYVWLAAGTSLALFLAARHWKGKYVDRTLRVDAVNNLFDALGLGAFVVTGIQAGLAAGYAENRFLLAVVGVLTGVGGGVLRDLMVGQIPSILRKRVYAVAAIAGAVCYLEIYRWTGSEVPAAAASVAVTLSLRLLATIFHWNLPRALD